MVEFGLKRRIAVVVLSLCAPAGLAAQAPAAVRQAGTVTAVDGSAVTIKTAAGATVTVTVAANAKVVQVPPGAKDLSAATPATVSDVAVGDKVLANGTAADASTLMAARVIIMKSTDITAMHAAEQREWQRGLGGLVKSVDAGTITVVSGAKTLTLQTTPATVFKKYAQDSVDFGDAQPSSIAMVHVGDQLRARGMVADDRLSMTAKEVVTGTFENLSGVISAVDPASGTLTLKDLSTKKMVTVQVTAKSDLRAIPPETARASRLAAELPERVQGLARPEPQLEAVPRQGRVPELLRVRGLAAERTGDGARDSIFRRCFRVFRRRR